MNMTLLAGKVALITGAGSGIGAAAAAIFAKEGAKVAVLDVKADEANRTVTTIEQAGGDAMSIRADVSQADQMQQAIQQIIERWGQLDIVFANAGVNGKWAPIEELEVEDWDWTLNVNLKGTFLTVKYAVPHLKVRGGAVVVTSSVNGTRVFSNTGATAYSCAKAAQVTFTKMIALELARYQIRVNVICPGAVSTRIGESTQQSPNLAKVRIPITYPEGRLILSDGKPAKPDQIAQLALFLVSDAASHITGTEMWIDGAESLLRG
jgi:NAD(P)-dependent dehydrogenase (short-subunit alcohol dehydrogenase family)